MGNFYNEWAKEKRHEYRTEKKKMTFPKAIKEITTDFVPKKIKNLNITKNIKKLKHFEFMLGTIIGITAGVSGEILVNNFQNKENNNIVKETETNDFDFNKYKSIIPIKVYYEIKAGDTLSAIADKYNIAINQIKVDEKTIDPNKILKVGTKINFSYNITNDEIRYATDEITQDVSTPDYILAFLYNTDTATINRLNENNLMPDTILVPNFKGIEDIEKEAEADYGYTKVK